MTVHIEARQEVAAAALGSELEKDVIRAVSNFPRGPSQHVAASWTFSENVNLLEQVRTCVERGDYDAINKLTVNVPECVLRDVKAVQRHRARLREYFADHHPDLVDRAYLHEVSELKRRSGLRPVTTLDSSIVDALRDPDLVTHKRAWKMQDDVCYLEKLRKKVVQGDFDSIRRITLEASETSSGVEMDARKTFERSRVLRRSLKTLPAVLEAAHLLSVDELKRLAHEASPSRDAPFPWLLADPAHLQEPLVLSCEHPPSCPLPAM